MNTNIWNHDPLLSHSACLTLSAAIVWAQSTPASKLKCPFALGDEACVWVGRAVEQSFMEMLWKRSFGVCVCGCVNYWHIQWVLSSFNFLLFPNASQEFVLFCQTEWKPWLFENNPFPCIFFFFLQWWDNWRDSRRKRERCVSFGEDSEQHRGEWSLILSIGTSRLARSAVSELQPPAFRGPCSRGLGGDSLDGRREGHPGTSALSKLLGSLHHPGDGETLLMMTDGLRMRLNLTWRK